MHAAYVCIYGNGSRSEVPGYGVRKELTCTVRAVSKDRDDNDLRSWQIFRTTAAI